MNTENYSLLLNGEEFTTPPVDTAVAQNIDSQGAYDSLVTPTIENPLPTAGIFLVLAAGTVALRRALHHNPRPWLEDR